MLVLLEEERDRDWYQSRLTDFHKLHPYDFLTNQLKPIGEFSRCQVIRYSKKNPLKLLEGILLGNKRIDQEASFLIWSLKALNFSLTSLFSFCNL